MSQDKNEALFRKYIDPKKVMIVDPCMGMRAGLGKTIVDMGAKSTNVKLCKDYDSAEQMMPLLKPDIVLCEYNLGGRCGLDLLQSQREQNPDSKNSVFILVTSNSSQSAVAQAAEEDIDNYIIKPFTTESLRTAIMRAALAKDFPTDYHQAIEEGKNLLLDGNHQGAMELFEKAMKLDPKPTLACFYHGQAFLMKQALDLAQGSYNRGLAYNRIHYKCLTGLFDVLMKREMFDGAYDVVKRIARYFPANPQRLTTVLRLAVMTSKFDDIERYYQVFTGIDTRSEDLYRYICAALVVCGKFYLRRDSKTRALVLFEKASIYASERTHILREIILTLLAFNMQREAGTFLKRFSPTVHDTPDFLAMKYVLNDISLTANESIEEGTKLLDKGVHYPEVYQTLIGRWVEAGNSEKAKTLADAAIGMWPEKREEFETKLQASAAARVG